MWLQPPHYNGWLTRILELRVLTSDWEQNEKSRFRLVKMCLRWFRRARSHRRQRPSTSEDTSVSAPLISTNGGRRQHSRTKSRGFVATSAKALAEALNPRVTFRKRNSSDDLELEKARVLTKEEVMQIRQGKLSRSQSYLTPNGNRCLRKLPKRSGKKTQYLFRSLTDIGQKV